MKKAGKLPAGNTAEQRQQITERTELKRYINSLAGEVHPEVLKKFGGTQAMRTHMLKQPSRLIPNLEAAQRVAKEYEDQQLMPLVLDVGIKSHAYWQNAKTIKSRKAREAKKKKKKKQKEKKKKNKGSKDSTSEDSEEESSSDEEAVALVMNEQESLVSVKERLQRIEKSVNDSKGMESRLMTKIDERMVHQRREIEEDLIKPHAAKIDKLSEMMLEIRDSVKTRPDQPQLPPSNLLPPSSMGPSRQPLQLTGPQGANPAQRPFARNFPSRPPMRPPIGMMRRMSPAGGQAGTPFMSRQGRPPITCFNCGQQGHPFRLCPQLSIVACVEALRAVENYDVGGTEACTVAHICQAFDEDGSIADDDIICHLAQNWAQGRINELYQGERRRFEEATDHGASQMVGHNMSREQGRQTDDVSKVSAAESGARSHGDTGAALVNAAVSDCKVNDNDQPNQDEQGMYNKKSENGGTTQTNHSAMYNKQHRHRSEQAGPHARCTDADPNQKNGSGSTSFDEAQPESIEMKTNTKTNEKNEYTKTKQKRERYPRRIQDESSDDENEIKDSCTTRSQSGDRWTEPKRWKTLIDNSPDHKNSQEHINIQPDHQAAVDERDGPSNYDQTQGIRSSQKPRQEEGAPAGQESGSRQQLEEQDQQTKGGSAEQSDEGQQPQKSEAERGEWMRDQQTELVANMMAEESQQSRPMPRKIRGFDPERFRGMKVGSARIKKYRPQHTGLVKATHKAGWAVMLTLVTMLTLDTAKPLAVWLVGAAIIWLTRMIIAGMNWLGKKNELYWRAVLGAEREHRKQQTARVTIQQQNRGEVEFEIERPRRAEHEKGREQRWSDRIMNRARSWRDYIRGKPQQPNTTVQQPQQLNTTVEQPQQPNATAGRTQTRTGDTVATMTAARVMIDTDYGTTSCIADSGCGPTIFPKSWLQRYGEKLGLRPSFTRLRAANGGKMGIDGTMPIKIKLPGTSHWMTHTIQVSGDEGLPEHVKILGNDFMKLCKMKMDWETESLRGTTPMGDSFELKVDMGQTEQAEWQDITAQLDTDGVVDEADDDAGESTLGAGQQKQKPDAYGHRENENERTKGTQKEQADREVFEVDAYGRRANETERTEGRQRERANREVFEVAIVETIVLEPGETKTFTGEIRLSSDEQWCKEYNGDWYWEPAEHTLPQGEVDQGSADDFKTMELTTPAYVSTSGEGRDIRYFMRNSTDDEIVIPQGTVVGWAHRVEMESIEQTKARLGITSPVATTKPRVITWVLAIAAALWLDWRALVVAGITQAAKASWESWKRKIDGASNNVREQHCASIEHETEEEGALRHTTVRHKPKTTLKAGDIRKEETGRQSIERIREQIDRDAKAKNKFRAWCAGPASKFRLGEQLTEEEKHEMLLLLYAYKELFEHNPSAPPPIDGIEYALYFRTDDPIPVRMRIPRLSPAQLEHMGKDTKTMLKNTIIQFSDSEWATRPVFARKKDGTWRYAIDYRKLNDQLVGDAHAIPNIPDTLEALSKAQRFSAFDVCAGFWGVRIRPKDRKYTAFHAIYEGSWQLFEFLRMPFGLKSATATFQRMFTKIMGAGACTCSASPGEPHTDQCKKTSEPLVNRICRVFVDDGLVYSNAKEDHVDDIAKVLKRLIANNMSLKPSKCIWGTEELPILGHKVVAGKGIMPDPDKVAAVIKMSKPQTSDMLRKFLGMTGYLSKFIPHYAEYAEPLRAITNRHPQKKIASIEYDWNEEAEAAYETLKVAVANIAMLNFPDFDQPFIVAVDASNDGLGAVLLQLDEDNLEKPIAYASTTLKKAEKNYGISHKEGLGVVWAVRKWRNYLLSNVAVVLTDHDALTSLTDPKKEFDNRRMARYALELSEYDLVIAHRPGRLLWTPDLLSRLEAIEDPTRIRDLMARVGSRSAQAAMRLQGELRKRLLLPKTQAARLKHYVEGAEIRSRAGSTKAESVIEVITAIKEGSITPKERQLLEEEEDTRVEDMYNMVCTVSTEKAILTRSARRAEGGGKGEKMEIKQKTQETQDLTRKNQVSTVETRSATKKIQEKSQNQKKIQEKDQKLGIETGSWMKGSQAETGTQEKQKVTGGESKLSTEKEMSTGTSEKNKAATAAPAAPAAPAATTERAQVEEETEADENPINLKRIIKAQMEDLFTMNMMKHIITRGKWLPEDEEQARKCTAWAGLMSIEDGILVKIKYRKGRITSNEIRRLPAVVQIYIPENARICEDIIKGIHKQLAHPGISRTYQAINDKFYWHGMWDQIKRHTLECVTCQMHAPRAAKAPMRGHITATKPAEVLTMDILHMMEVQGYKYLLVVVDIFSRYGAAVPLKDIKAESVVRALQQEVLCHGYGRPKTWVIDGGSEFKGTFKEVAGTAGWGAQIHQSSPNHPQSHGAIERFNRTLQNKMGKLLSDESNATWMDVRPAALEAYNACVHAAISDGEVQLAPADVWFARNPVLDTVPTKELPKSSKVTAYARELRQQWEWVVKIVRENTKNYQKKMRESDPNQFTRLRKFNIGDEVLLWQSTGSRRMDKINPLQRGPYKVIEIEPQKGRYVISRVGSQNKRDEKKVHVNDIKLLRRFATDGAAEALLQNEKKPASKTSKSYQVESIAGERGGAQGSQKQFLVKWEGYTEHTWEPQKNLNCPELVSQWTALSKSEQKARYKRAVRAGIVAAVVDAQEGLTDEETELNNRLEELISQGVVGLGDDWSGDSNLRTLCERLGISVKAIAAIVISPPQETFIGGQTRDNLHFRDFNTLKQSGKPRAVNDSSTRDERDRHQTAIEHDAWISAVAAQSLELHKMHNIPCVWEVPRGALERTPSVTTAAWLQNMNLCTIHRCAYREAYHRATNIWTTMSPDQWRPTGTTGNGQCGGHCLHRQANPGHKRERNRARQGAPSMLRLNVTPAEEQELWTLPRELQQELLQGIESVQHSPTEQKYIIHLHAGVQQRGWKEEAKKFGYHYLPINIRDTAALVPSGRPGG
jgi:transposase InsO family protein